MKKILLVIQSIKIGGAERALVTLANKLAEAGYDVTVLIWLPKYEYAANLDRRVRLIYKAPDEHLGNKIPYIRYKFYDDAMWSTRANPRQFYRYYVGNEKYDVEIAFFHSWAVKIVSGSTNKKAVHIAWIHHDFLLLSESKPKEWNEYREMYRKFDDIVCVSENAKKSFVKVIGDTGNLHTIYNMLPINDILTKAEYPPREKVKKGGFHVVLVGRYHTTKGYDRMIHAVAKLRREGRDITLALIGAGEIEPVLEMISEYDAGDYITTVYGDTNPYPYIKEASLLVCASLTEGYNLTIAEALIIGTPVLTTDCKGPNEILDNGKYGMIVNNSEKGLYDGLKKLCDSPELLADYRERTKQRMDFFDEDRIFKQITDLFERRG